MGGCLRGGGAYKLLREKKREKRHESQVEWRRTEREKAGERKRERERGRGGNFSILSGYPGPFNESRKEEDLQFRGKNTSGYLRDKVPYRTKRLRASRIPPSSPSVPQPTHYRSAGRSPRRTLVEEREGEKRRRKRGQIHMK